MSNSKPPRSLLNRIGWVAAIAVVLTLLAINIRYARRLNEVRKPLRALQQEHQLMQADVEGYRAVSEEMNRLAQVSDSHRWRIRSMLRACRDREDFVVRSGPRIVAQEIFHDSQQQEPAVFLYIPPGNHRLIVATKTTENPQEMHRFLSATDLSQDKTQEFGLAQEQIYEVRFYPMDDNKPTIAGLELIGSTSNTDESDSRVAELQFDFPRPVVRVTSSRGSDVYELPGHNGSAKPAVEKVFVHTHVRSKVFSFSQEPQPLQGAVRIFLASETTSVPAHLRAFDSLISYMRQPESAKTNMNDLFHRGDGFVELLSATEAVSR